MSIQWSFWPRNLIASLYTVHHLQSAEYRWELAASDRLQTLLHIQQQFNPRTWSDRPNRPMPLLMFRADATGHWCRRNHEPGTCCITSASSNPTRTTSRRHRQTPDSCSDDIHSQSLTNCSWHRYYASIGFHRQNFISHSKNNQFKHKN